MSNGYYDLFRLPNEEIRPSSSPQDATLVYRKGDATVVVPFKVGTKVYALPMTELTVVDDNGNSVVTTPDTGEMCLIFGKAVNMQI